MKLKGITKLVLAGTALAATAATLTTSTYAWYVTNASVEAKGVSGSVASTSTGSLYIAKNTVVSTADVPGVYKTDITLDLANKTSGDNPTWVVSDIAEGKYTSDDLEPQSKALAITTSGVTKYYYKTKDTSQQGTKTYYTIGGTSTTKEATPATIAANTDWSTLYEEAESLTWVDDKGHLTTGKLITFKYWLKSNAGGQVDVELTVDNTTAAATPQIALASDGLPTGVLQGDSFVSDAVHALRMEVKQTAYNTTTTYVACGADDVAVAGTKYYSDDQGTEPASQPATGASVDGMYVAQKNYNSIAAGENTGTVAPAIYQVDEIALDKTGGNYDTKKTTAYTRTDSPISFVTGGDANNYYTSIIGASPYNVTSGTSNDASTGAAAWTSINLAANKDTLLEFNIWLEGSDADCWDSARGQSFTFDFQFKLHASV